MTQKEIKQLASEVVGDGKSPNMFFVTAGPYIRVTDEFGDFDTELMDGFDDTHSETFGPFNTLEDAEKVYDDIELDIYSGTCEVFIEDRKTGTIKEKYLTKIIRTEYQFNETDDTKYFGYKK